MNARRILTIGASALILGAPMIGGPALLGGLAVANGKAVTQDARQAAKEAASARKALKGDNAQRAVTHAEAAVTLDPTNGAYRTLLGETYLHAGRFVSAAQALNEALSLDPANGRIALNLALSQIATGEWTTARQTLETHAASIATSDRGLAFALAGDPGTAVAILADAARQPGADAKTRQNLALSLALAGQWQQARAIAAIDLSPDQLDTRIMQWATFARPQNAYDQVATLLGVTPVADNGQPQRLALSQSKTTAVAAQGVVVDPVDQYMPRADSASAVAAAPAGDVAMTGESVAPSIVAQDGKPQIVFAPRKEVVQAITRAVETPVAVAKSPVGTARRVAIDTSPVRTGKGNWFVQLGAYDSAGVARDAWGRAARRSPALRDLTPSSATVSTRGGTFHRLSVGGFDRAGADALCGTLRSQGGTCFVRGTAGDTAAAWAKSAR